MARFIVTLILCTLSAHLLFADYCWQADCYIKEAEYYQRKADNYRREAQYYLKKADGYERDAASIQRQEIPVGQMIFNEKRQEQWTITRSGCVMQRMLTKKLLTICERHRIF